MTWHTWICERCDGLFKTERIARQCSPCTARAAAIAKCPLPYGEMSGS